MGYQHGRTAQPLAGLVTVEQARRRNAELRRELAELASENAALGQHVQLLRRQVSDGRKLLTRKIRDLAAIRSQVEQLESVKARRTEPSEPVFGGPEGLQAATAEMDAHESKGLNLVTRRPSKGPSHGTRRRYDTGCRCDPCLLWRERKSEQARSARRSRKVAA